MEFAVYQEHLRNLILDQSRPEYSLQVPAASSQGSLGPFRRSHRAAEGRRNPSAPKLRVSAISAIAAALTFRVVFERRIQAWISAGLGNHQRRP